MAASRLVTKAGSIYDNVGSPWVLRGFGRNQGQVLPVVGQSWRPHFEVDCDFRDTAGKAQWVVRLGVALLISPLWGAPCFAIV